jgi:CubicO group peptidase (beta-lactamase class C family)
VPRIVQLSVLSALAQGSLLGSRSSTVTLEQLMHHTSGVRDYFKLPGSQGHPESELTTRQQAPAKLRTAKLSFRPGSDWEHSNSNYLLLGEVVPEGNRRERAPVCAKEDFTPLSLDLAMEPQASVRGKAVSGPAAAPSAKPL